MNERYVLTTCCHGTPALEIENASKELHGFIRRILSCNYMGDYHYELTRRAGAFFQGGSNLEEGWLLIEFWKPSGAQEFIDYININAPT